ncbi:hypothetical protein OIDMADRAFT_60705 [Oidiodendron maius Zn]|uniref:Uncharacterized protein n=1 Tax=Oidiodendron maius (strain Zn) TaxID=913774 RepID=A0A0C3GDZ5_OIDMZ|nr:hypothetical protein OIDMADRAFT_60705 [Oidiodendron maius Zn]
MSSTLDRSDELMFFIHSKKSHQDSKSRSTLVSLHSLKKPKSSLEHRISSSQKSGHHTSHSDWPAAKATLSSINTPMFDSISNTYQTSHVNTHEQLAHTEVDLLKMGSWTYHHESPQYYADTQHQTRDINESSPCPYHTAVMGFYYNATGAGYGLAPLERWLNEGVGDEGSVALQLGQQLGVECTCIDLELNKERYN